mmetsp:Transcript_41367/g.89666  ORF Transcript_41367/g.89666 Transcript_41367/m.89666 type:complete len:216 (-) Transcript_41367:455-1102(-)
MSTAARPFSSFCICLAHILCAHVADRSSAHCIRCDSDEVLGVRSRAPSGSGGSSRRTDSRDTARRCRRMAACRGGGSMSLERRLVVAASGVFSFPFTFPLPFTSTALPAFGTTEACAGAAAAGAGAAGAGTALVGSASGAAAAGGGEVLCAAGNSFRFAEPLPFIRHRVRKSLPGEAGTEVFPSTSLNSSILPAMLFGVPGAFAAGTAGEINAEL